MDGFIRVSLQGLGRKGKVPSDMKGAWYGKVEDNGFQHSRRVLKGNGKGLGMEGKDPVFKYGIKRK